jgi:bis(5'-nucleosyl)-tetraphosphatase (symmetrical)
MSKEKETVIIGDIHGCYDELMELMRYINTDKMRVIFVGDIGDRGLKSAECIWYVKDLCKKGLAECVMGNHENKHIRYRAHEIRKSFTRKENPMRALSATDLDFHHKLSGADIDWMRNLPVKINVKDNWWVLHGGLEPAYSFDNQSDDQVMRCRYVSNGKYTTSNGKVIRLGKAVPLNKDKSQPDNTVYWTDAWNGSQSVVYGHCVHSLHTPLIDARPRGVKCVGIDTGCVFGGFLTAYLLNANEFIKVKSKKEYVRLDATFED